METASVISGLLSQALGTSVKGINKRGEDNAFGSIFAALKQPYQDSGQTPLVAPQADQLGQAPEFAAPRLASPAGTPVAKLERSLKKTGEPMDNLKLPAESREELAEVLKESGFSDEDVEEILTRAAKDDGSINLGALFSVLPEYPAAEAPVFTIDQQDLPQLIQVLKDLGLGEERIQKFVEGLPVNNGKIEVSGLADLVAEAIIKKAETGDVMTVDRAVVRDLLASLGLNEKEVEAILSQAVDQKGRSNPQAVLKALEQAAATQDRSMTTGLKELAAKIELNSEARERPQAEVNQNVQRIREQVTQALKEMDAEVKPFEKQTAEKSTFQDMLKAAAKGVEKKPDAEAEALAGQAKPKDIRAQAGTELRPAAQSPEASRAENPTVRVQGVSAGEGLSLKASGTQPQAATRTGRALPGYVVRQVSQKMAEMVRGNQSSFKLQLKPAHLGNMSLELTSKEGGVRATLVAESVAAKNTLEVGMDQLRQTLAQQGIKIDRIEVVLSPDAREQQFAQAGAGGNNGSRGGGGKGGSGGAADADTAETEIPAAAIAGSSEYVNLFA